MDARGLSSAEVAYLLYVSEATVYRWVANRTSPHPGHLKALANLFGVHVQDLYDTQEAA